MKWVKSNYYVTPQSDTIVLESGGYYVDNRLSVPLSYYSVTYSDSPYGNGSSEKTIIDANTVQKIDNKPDYILESPPSVVYSKSKRTVKWVLY